MITKLHIGLGPDDAIDAIWAHETGKVSRISRPAKALPKKVADALEIVRAHMDKEAEREVSAGVAQGLGPAEITSLSLRKHALQREIEVKAAQAEEAIAEASRLSTAIAIAAAGAADARAEQEAAEKVKEAAVAERDAHVVAKDKAAAAAAAMKAELELHASAKAEVEKQLAERVRQLAEANAALDAMKVTSES